MNFTKILVANRGEIACRIARTIHKLNKQAIGIYTANDRTSLHVQQFTHLVQVKSYTDIPSICAAARDVGADAVHPGFGFLAENHCFAQALEEAEITLIGPSVRAIKLMGDKISAKEAAMQARVNIMPSYVCDAKDITYAREIVRKIGLPVIIKAAAGGGGKGMRVVRSLQELPQALALASSEAKKIFHDERVFIEKYLANPRHIEVQVLADKYDNIVCLGERECSIQRRHQKVIEETPSLIVDEETRKELYKQSVLLARKVNYYSAGTVEFIFGDKKNFYFLEMNTRLQVEHPITELVTGIDIVAEMIRIAEGKALTITQEDLVIKGHAIECRICAENPYKNFLPETGHITAYHSPELPGIRIDSGVTEGTAVTAFYDPMIAKICSYSNTREDAIKLMQKALSIFCLKGVIHNIPFLEAIIHTREFLNNEIHTELIQKLYPNGLPKDNYSEQLAQIFCIATVHIYIAREYRCTKKNNFCNREWTVFINDKGYPLIVFYKDTLQIIYRGNEISSEMHWVPTEPLLTLVINDQEYIIKVSINNDKYILSYRGIGVMTRMYSNTCSYFT